MIPVKFNGVSTLRKRCKNTQNNVNFESVVIGKFVTDQRNEDADKFNERNTVHISMVKRSGMLGA